MNYELFDLEVQYQFYLKKVGLDESKMPTSQRIETKRAFMGGAAQIVMFFYSIGINDDFNEYERLKILDQIFKQTYLFWNSEINNTKR